MYYCVRANVQQSCIKTINLRLSYSLTSVSSSGGGMRHIRLRNYWIKDYVDCGELRIEYSPIADMRADILTKVLKGSLFQRQRSMLLGQLN